MPGKIVTTILPPGWKVSDNVKNQAQVSTTFKYYLNDVATLGKLKKHAVPTPMEQKSNKDNSISLQFSTGAYMKAVLPLIKFYKECEGDQIRKSDIDNMSAVVRNIETETDAGGKITGYLVRLEVEGEKVTVTFYDTQVNMRVQGKKQMEEYFKRALLPYLWNQIDSNLEKIAQINLQFRQLGKTVMSRQSSNVQPFKSTRSGGQRFLTEQQLGDSAIDADQLEDLNISEGSFLNSSNLLLTSSFHPEGYLVNRMSEFDNSPPPSPRRLTENVVPSSRMTIQTLPRSSTPLPTVQQSTLIGMEDEPLPAGKLDVNPHEQEPSVTVDSLEEQPLPARELELQRSIAAPSNKLEVIFLEKEPSDSVVCLGERPPPAQGLDLKKSLSTSPNPISILPTTTDAPSLSLLEKVHLPAQGMVVQKPSTSLPAPIIPSFPDLSNPEASSLIPLDKMTVAPKELDGQNCSPSSDTPITSYSPEYSSPPHPIPQPRGYVLRHA